MDLNHSISLKFRAVVVINLYFFYIRKKISKWFSSFYHHHKFWGWFFPFLISSFFPALAFISIQYRSLLFYPLQLCSDGGLCECWSPLSVSGWVFIVAVLVSELMSSHYFDKYILDYISSKLNYVMFILIIVSIPITIHHQQQQQQQYLCLTNVILCSIWGCQMLRGGRPAISMGMDMVLE